MTAADRTEKSCWLNLAKPPNMFVVRFCDYLDDNPEITKSKPGLNSDYSMLNTSVCLEREFPERLVLGSVYDVTAATYGRQTY